MDVQFAVKETNLGREEGFQGSFTIGVQTFYFMVRETKKQASWYNEMAAKAFKNLVGGIVVNPKALPEDRVMVVNYRSRYKPWEWGTVRWVKAGFDKDGATRLSYEVLLDRTTTGRSRMFPDGGGPIFLTVGDDQISKE